MLNFNQSTHSWLQLQEDGIGFCSEGVLKIADKYDVTELVAKCSEAMTDGLTMDNAIDTLITADKFSMIKFKKLVRTIFSR